MKAWQHFKTITHHKWLVLQGCFRVGLYWQGITHDLSKYMPTEFMVGVRYFQGNRSPNAAEREEKGFSEAWMHHKGRNRHHFEYWTDYNPKTRTMEPVEMPDRYVIEMFCDRVAASKIYGGKNYTDEYALNYYLRGCDVRRIHPETARKIEFLLRHLAEKGEKETFRLIRKERKGGLKIK